jgi:hypothetical protein
MGPVIRALQRATDTLFRRAGRVVAVLPLLAVISSSPIVPTPSKMLESGSRTLATEGTATIMGAVGVDTSGIVRVEGASGMSKV